MERSKVWTEDETDGRGRRKEMEMGRTDGQMERTEGHTDGKDRNYGENEQDEKDRWERWKSGCETKTVDRQKEL